MIKLTFLANTRVLVVLFILIQGSLLGLIIQVPPAHHHQVQLSGLRASSLPYISGDTFRMACDLIIDERQRVFNTDWVKNGSVIFLKANLIPFFFTRIHPYITKRYILVTHNSVQPAPGKFIKYLNDKKIIAWFGQNCDSNAHKKFIPIPVGIANRYWSIGDIKVFDNVRERTKNHERPWLVYLNCVNTHPERQEVNRLFSSKPWCVNATKKPHPEFLEDLARCKFILCPRGNGLDCHRTWEVLLMGAIPIMKHSTLDPLFAGLPVVLINKWSDVTEDFLEKTYAKIQRTIFATDRMFGGYWLKLIAQAKKL